MEHDILMETLVSWFSRFKKGVVAFSGGVDSMFLLEAAGRYFKGDIMAVTAVPPYIAESELDDIMSYIEGTVKTYKIVSVPFPEELRYNPPDRCYICKKHLFAPIISAAAEFGADVIMEGSNIDDLNDYRPGQKALKELKIRSPLLECGFEKRDIRYAAGKWGLPAAEKPAYSCLLTRFPHDTEINFKDLLKVEKAENFLHNLGIRAVRVRVHGESARIEMDIKSMEKLSDPEFRKMIDDGIKKAGFKYVSVDLAGYRMGNMNRIKETDEKNQPERSKHK